MFKDISTKRRANNSEANLNVWLLSPSFRSRCVNQFTNSPSPSCYRHPLHFQPCRLLSTTSPAIASNSPEERHACVDHHMTSPQLLASVSNCMQFSFDSNVSTQKVAQFSFDSNVSTQKLAQFSFDSNVSTQKLAQFSFDSNVSTQKLALECSVFVRLFYFPAAHTT